MTPKEKSEELFNKMFEVKDSFSKFEISYDIAKQCALIAVDEIMDAIDWHEFEVPNDQLKYLFKVKQEIEKL